MTNIGVAPLQPFSMENIHATGWYQNGNLPVAASFGNGASAAQVASNVAVEEANLNTNTTGLSQASITADGNGQAYASHFQAMSTMDTTNFGQAQSETGPPVAVLSAGITSARSPCSTAVYFNGPTSATEPKANSVSGPGIAPRSATPKHFSNKCQDISMTASDGSLGTHQGQSNTQHLAQTFKNHISIIRTNMRYPALTKKEMRERAALIMKYSLEGDSFEAISQKLPRQCHESNARKIYNDALKRMSEVERHQHVSQRQRACYDRSLCALVERARALREPAKKRV